MASLYEMRLGLPHISTGEIFRQEITRESALGRRVKRYVISGRLVPDALVVEVMVARLDAKTLATGFVLDGFPRTAGQAAGLDRALQRTRAPLDGAVYLRCSQALLIRRLSGRRVCANCGANYHLRTMRPKRPGRCDRCGGSLIIRKDDQAQTIKKRLEVDRHAAQPLLRYYQRRGELYTVNGAGHVDTVFQRTVRLCEQLGWLRGRRDDPTPC